MTSQLLFPISDITLVFFSISLAPGPSPNSVARPPSTHSTVKKRHRTLTATQQQEHNSSIAISLNSKVQNSVGRDQSTLTAKYRNQSDESNQLKAAKYRIQSDESNQLKAA